MTPNLSFGVKSSSRYQLRPSIVLRKFQSSYQMSKLKDETILREKYKPRECRFKTPYGHIAGLEWGQPDAPHKIICAHGWLDNAGSFERLIPFVLDHKNNANKFHIIAMDMPGVGLSSHRPPGADYTQFSVLAEMRRIIIHMKWQKVILLAHSLGSHHSFLFSCIYPQFVQSFISIDLSHPITHQIHNWNIAIANSIEERLKSEYNHEDEYKVPVYSEVDALKRLMDGHSASLTLESAKVLMKRGVKKHGWGYTFTRDTRWRFLGAEFKPNDDAMLQYLSGTFKPNFLIIRASRSLYFQTQEARSKYYSLYQRNCPLFRDVMLEGTHHLHMNTPELVSIEINKFLDDVESVGLGDVEISKSNL